MIDVEGQLSFRKIPCDITDCRELPVRPLTDKEIAGLKSNLPLQLDSVNVDILVYELYSCNCINRWQKEYLTQRISESMKQVAELVGILVRRSYADFKLFLNVLENTGHQHVARVVREGGGL